MIANGAAQHGILCFERIEDRPLRYWRWDIECDLATDVSEVAEMCWKNNADHISTLPFGVHALLHPKLDRKEFYLEHHLVDIPRTVLGDAFYGGEFCALLYVRRPIDFYVEDSSPVSGSQSTRIKPYP